MTSTRSTRAPRLVIVAGANGSGKSTLTQRWVRRFGARLGEVLDPDAIARTINPDDPRRAGVSAARQVLQRTQVLLEGGQDFLIETTLSDKNRHLELIEGAKARGYRVWLLYIGVDSVALNASRVRERVRAGGHDVPERDIVRRRQRGLANLPETLRRVDRALVYDNSGRALRVVASVQDVRVRGLGDSGWWSAVVGTLAEP